MLSCRDLYLSLTHIRASSAPLQGEASFIPVGMLRSVPRDNPHWVLLTALVRTLEDLLVPSLLQEVLIVLYLGLRALN